MQGRAVFRQKWIQGMNPYTLGIAKMDRNCNGHITPQHSVRYYAGAVEPSAQRCTFAHPIFGPTVRKMQNLRTQFSGL